jgi:hypothetical protein
MFASATHPTILLNKTTRGKEESLNGFTIASSGIESLDVGVGRAAGEVNEILLLSTDERPQLPVSSVVEWTTSDIKLGYVSYDNLPSRIENRAVNGERTYSDRT